ncbi:acyl-CoA dehydrogenase [Amylibacter sp. IMCC11727]|uniref:acyl-CoA dehydrogenase family protein n=1 Tax=Amylibacter sp. IMCC11727 TaxID=3039851 RepID=UPI00244E2966|nr:acyl-CoA dehydrogenase [Amylibacter sp. IMCC11727]WGI21248.1 acyl-CoA dehydrogenase [Amylibacter sp. IMCC11727]
MNFDLTDERQMLQDGLRRYLADAYTAEARKKIEDDEAAFSPDIWTGLAEMGVIGALFREEDGGFAGEGFDIALVFEELGRIGAVDPLIDTAVLGGGLIAVLGTDAQKDVIETVIAGGAHLAVAHGEPSSRFDMPRVETTATKGADGYTLNGRKAIVVNAPSAENLIVSARTSGDIADTDGISLFIIPADTDGMTLRSYPIVGGGHAAEVTLSDVSVPNEAMLGAEGAAYDAISAMNARATLAICAEALGLMESIKTLTNDYLKTRKQFGVPIGKFQALQHRLADVLIEIEQARSAVINLAGHVDAEPSVRDVHVSATKNLIGLAARLVVEEGIQMHGGIGMTNEYELGHLAKRLTMIDHRFGDTDYHMEQFIKLAVA